MVGKGRHCGQIWVSTRLYCLTPTPSFTPEHDGPCSDEYEEPPGKRRSMGEVPHFLPHEDGGEQSVQEPGSVLLT